MANQTEGRGASASVHYITLEPGSLPSGNDIEGATIGMNGPFFEISWMDEKGKGHLIQVVAEDVLYVLANKR